jgi:hypothetical protein
MNRRMEKLDQAHQKVMWNIGTKEAKKAFRSYQTAFINADSISKEYVKLMGWTEGMLVK